MRHKWVTFTRRTNDPKLSWLERQLDEAFIPHRRQGRSFHAPILEVPAGQLDAAWRLLTPAIDNAPDDAPMFSQAPEEYLPPIRVMLDCTREWVAETTVTFENIEEDIQGRDVLTFTCPKCDQLHRSLRIG